MIRRLFFCASIFLLNVSVVAQQHYDEIRKSIFFGGGSYYVDEAQIEELYDWLDSIPNLLDKYDIHLISHTDPIGGKEYNDWLSKMRSEAVEQIILNRGDISERKITIKDWGLENPVYSNQSYNGMQMNRRVDVILYPIIF
jgi:outer membrane protein OmpA-like peptidoglycan-associated protein